jgi:phage terminase large subunit
MPFVLTTAVKKMLGMTKPKKVIQGSTSSGKTYGIIPILYDRALEKPRTKITIVAETLPAVREGALDIFVNFMMDEGRWNDERWNASSLTYTCGNGSRLQFKSFDSVGKAKASGKRDIVFLNEANHIDYEIADALIVRSEEVWMDFNADMEFWAHTEILTHDDSEFLKLTFEDNEAIPQATLNELLKRKAKAEAEERSGNLGYWWNWWQVYGLGEIGRLLESVYSRWEILDKKPERFTQFVYGLDFGYEHPTALTRIWFWENERFVEEVIYQNGLTSAPLVDKMKKLGVEDSIEILADHARPEMIEDLSNAGFYVLKANKSVEAGINYTNECVVYVHKDSVNIQRENRLYKRKVVNGRVQEDIVKRDDDAMDSIRYANLYIKENYSSNSAYLTL